MNEEIKSQLKSHYAPILEKAGFSQKEAQIYEAIMQSGQIGINELLKITSFKRGDLYNLVYSLRDKGVIEQTIKNHVIQFKPMDPYHLIEYIEKKKAGLQEASATVEALLPQLFSDYNLIMNKPTIHYLEGITGVRKVYDLINASGEKEFLLFRSIYDNDEAEEQKIIDQQKIKQVKLGIRMRFISPLTEKTRDHYFNTDDVKNVERRIIQKTKFMLPAQILVWGDVVAIISMKKEKVITIMHNKDIAETFRTLFEYIWESSEEFHNKTIESWKKE